MTLDEVFLPSGLLSQHFPDYEQRTSQVSMAKLVEKAIQDKKPAVIEGATGVGKSFAYLIPLLFSGKKAIISTSNKSLQDQLSNKDLPLLKKILPIQFDWAVLKGKNNYFCHEHFQINQKDLLAYYQNEGLSKTEATLKLQEIADWAEQTEDGDIEYYPYELSYTVKELITCDTKTVHDRQSNFYNLCFANRARENAKGAQIILVNHTLLALDIALKRETDGKAKILPDAEVFIIDEAHTFEKSAVMAFSDDISFHSLLHLINSSPVRKSLTAKDLSRLSEAFKGALQPFIPEKGNRGYYNQKKFEKFDTFGSVIILLTNLIEKVKSNQKLSSNDAGALKVKEITKEAQNLIDRLEALGEIDDNMLRWSEAKDGSFGPLVRLRSVPLDVSNLLKNELFKKHTVICTSATLATNGSFDFFKYQVGMPESALELIAESPFNFKENSLIYITTGEQEKYWEIQELLSYSKGRAFVLFTSYKDMEDCYFKVSVPYTKLIQSNEKSRVQLLEEFKNTPNAVLFATKSFWEGVDVKGDQLLMVIIYKIPFENPSDLVYASKIEKIDKEFGKGKHWTKLTIPDACLKLKQGVGRLIRSKTDIGVIALLDARVGYQNYGKAVLNSLPPAFKTQKLEKVKNFYEKWNR